MKKHPMDIQEMETYIVIQESCGKRSSKKTKGNQCFQLDTKKSQYISSVVCVMEPISLQMSLEFLKHEAVDHIEL